MSIKRIGVLTSGGDAPGMNAAVRSVVRTAMYYCIECYGILRGYNGLIHGDVIRLDEKKISHIINRGGTVLYTARSKEFMTEEGQKKAASTCKFLGLDGIVDVDAFFVVLLLKRHGGSEEIQTRQGRLSPLERDGAGALRHRKALFDDGFQGVLRHKTIGSLLPLFHNVMVEAVAAVQVAHARSGLDKQMDGSHTQASFLYQRTAAAPVL